MKLHIITTAILFSSIVSASSPENQMNSMQNLLKDTYEFEQRRRELREENRCNRECTPPTEELSYHMVKHINDLIDQADGKTTTATIWNPNRELSEWELLQDDEFTLLGLNNNYEKHLRAEKIQEIKDSAKLVSYIGIAAVAIVAVDNIFSRN